MNALKKKSIPSRKKLILKFTGVICLLTVLKVLPVQSKPLMPDEGQGKLMQEVNAGQKSKQLTLKEANKLRKQLASVARKKKKMLDNPGRKLSAEDTAELKSDINKISENLHKFELQKTTIAH